jgi:leucyl-tRNA synthetase
MMMLLNEWDKVKSISKDEYKLLLQLLAPFAPHLTEELWHELGEETSIHESSWPIWDKDKVVDQTINIVIQVNGKVRSQISIDKGLSEEKKFGKYIYCKDILI